MTASGMHTPSTRHTSKPLTSTGGPVYGHEAAGGAAGLLPGVDASGVVESAGATVSSASGVVGSEGAEDAEHAMTASVNAVPSTLIARSIRRRRTGCRRRPGN